MKNGKNLGLKVGAIFSVVSFLFTFTIAIPMISVFPSELLGQGISLIFSSSSFKTIGITTLSFLAVLLIALLMFTFKKVKKSAEENRKLKISEIVIIMVIFYLVVHNLGYYIVLAANNFPIDALNTIMSVISFPFSSLSFVLLGFLMDWNWKKKALLN